MKELNCEDKKKRRKTQDLTYLLSGIRISELVGLDLRDVNLKDSCVTVILKGGDEKRVYFHESVSRILRAYLTGLDPDHLFSGDGDVLGRGNLVKPQKRCDALFSFH